MSLRSSDLGDFSDPNEDDEEDADELLVADSPEPPEPLELDDTMQTDEEDRLHPEQDLPYIFKVGLQLLVLWSQDFDLLILMMHFNVVNIVICMSVCLIFLHG